jgi:hypothetical protein
MLLDLALKYAELLIFNDVKQQYSFVSANNSSYGKFNLLGYNAV